MPVAVSPPRPKLRVAICGGGLGGLALAVSLAHHAHPDAPIDIQLYEAHAEIATVGAGISVWPRTWRVFQLMGLYSEMAKVCVRPPSDIPRPGFCYRRADREQDTYNFHQMMIPFGVATMHRADMMGVLCNSLPPSCQVHTSKRLARYSELPPCSAGSSDPGAVRLHFTDGTTADTDVLVGADGIKSATRGAMYDLAHARDCASGCTRAECERCRAATPHWSGTVTYRYLIPTEQLRARNPEHHALTRTMSYCGIGKHLVTYPISHGKYINWIGFMTTPGGEGTPYQGKWVVPATKEEVMGHYIGWEKEVQELNECVEGCTRWAIHTMGALPFAVSGNVALMGDAAHATETHLGAGAGQAIEDAYVLGRLLAHPRTTRARLARVLRVYEGARLPFAQAVVQRSRTAGRLGEFRLPGAFDGRCEGEREREGLRALGAQLEEQWRWHWEERFDATWAGAEAAFGKLVEEEDAVEVERASTFASASTVEKDADTELLSRFEAVRIQAVSG